MKKKTCLDYLHFLCINIDADCVYRYIYNRARVTECGIVVTCSECGDMSLAWSNPSQNVHHALCIYPPAMFAKRSHCVSVLFLSSLHWLCTLLLCIWIFFKQMILFL